jgi:PEP-CTERM/exosortase A-associated glycosyltransferase
MRILHILDHSIPLHSGYTFRTLAILKQQRALGWETFQITSPKQGIYRSPLESVEDGWDFYRTPNQHLMAQLPLLKQFAVIQNLSQRLYEVALQTQPDILHAHSPALNAIAALQIGKRLGIPVVYEVRAFWEDAAVDHGTSREWGLRYRLTRAMETFALRRVQAITTICEGLRDDILLRGITADKVTVIPNAVNVSDFQIDQQVDSTLARELGLQGKVVLGFIGSFYAYEGLNILLQALPNMLISNPDIRVLLVGGGPQDSALKQQSHELGISQQVIFTGRVPHDEVQRYYNLIDVLVYPRQKMRLTDLVTPLKPLEAMAQGRLLAASDVGGHRELITDGKNGILFAANDPQSLARQVLDLIVQPERWQELRSAARHFVETERNWTQSVARYKDVYAAAQRRSS